MRIPLRLPFWLHCLVLLLAWPTALFAGGFSIVTYNTGGNGATDWSTNAAQVRAIARQMQFLNPDIITFQEIPHTNVWQRTNFMAAFLPGYHLAANSGTDGFLRSVIASRFPITRSAPWLDGVSLAAFGYNGSFTRDLFEAEIAVPGLSQPLHVFTTHLKAFPDSISASRRAAEAGAISNFLVTGFLTTNALRPYLLTGDLNEDILRPSSANQPIQRLTDGNTGLRLTRPVNPFTGDDRTISIRSGLSARFDYILPCALLASNIVSSQVFRTDLLAGPPPPLLANDSRTASDHLPVMMVFNDPWARPFRISSVGLSNTVLRLTWETVPGGRYAVDATTNLTAWSTLATNVVATGYSTAFSTNSTAPWRFYRVRVGQ